MMSFLPVVVMLAAAYMWYTAIILFIPAVILTNYYIAKKNTPMIICQKCRAVTKGKDAEEAAGAV
ncbi:hypothetical protein [Salsuginibacillus halophilus]|nr:hypothetical protein [Salsuginibacillus halophilus]